MTGAIFEPDSLPNIQGMAAAFNLDSMTYLDNPSALIRLRQELKKAGFDDAQRKITAAIKRRDNQLNPSRFLRVADDVLFEFTCGYGTDGIRPLLLIIALTYIFFNVYLFLYLTQRLRLTIYFEEVTVGKDEVKTKSIPLVIQIQKIFFFTVVATFSVGFGEFNFDDWVKRLSGREYTMAASGLTRILMGIQSLLCLLLFALAILIYFGDPFNE
jgi:hypothetical protein